MKSPPNNIDHFAIIAAQTVPSIVRQRRERNTKATGRMNYCAGDPYAHLAAEIVAQAIRQARGEVGNSFYSGAATAANRRRKKREVVKKAQCWLGSALCVELVQMAGVDYEQIADALTAIGTQGEF